ncbi:unnamed protein product [Protopolystoma xenopodis]|uniref:Uncharacterized protein n=1 Tax=Protopolystoma xenopodis TaxID=117903 RepID=A0A448WGH3_9PLAT|nr:unnamed protein product [Protopolystoma xenopodis]
MSSNFHNHTSNPYNSSDPFRGYLNYQAHSLANYGNQPNAYPLFHSAAVAAVAAAAAEYSQHFNSNNAHNSLNLATSNPAVHFNNLTDYSCNVTQPLPIQDHASQPHFSYDQSLTTRGPLNKPLTVATSSYEPHPAPIPDYPARNTSHKHANVSRCAPDGHELNNPDHSFTTKGKSKGRKSVPSNDCCQKRKEFEELVKARTNMLMSEGVTAATSPLAQAPATTGTCSSSSSGSLTGVPPLTCKEGSSILSSTGQSHHSLLMQAILDSKKRALLRLPSITACLSRQQRTARHHKRQTELFSVTVRNPPTTQVTLGSSNQSSLI